MLLKIAAYCSYIAYLILSDNFLLTLAVVPLILFFVNRSYAPWLLLLFFCFDVDWSMALITPYGATNTFWGNQTSSFWVTPFIILSSLALIILLARLLAFLRKKSKAYTLPFILSIAVLIIELFRWTTFHPLASILSLVAKKYWIMFLLAIEYQYSSLTFKQTVAGLVAPAIFREFYKVENYEIDGYASLRLGGLLAAITCLAILIYNQVFYQLTGLLTPTVINNSWTLNLVCHSSLTTLAPVEAFTKKELLGCFLANDFLQGIIKHIFLDSMIFVIPGLMMGWKFPLPFSNFFTAKNWPNFLYKLFYYYALIIYRLFTVEFYHLLQFLFKKRSPWHLPIATFLGVFVGGYCFHALKDFAYVQQFTSNSIFTILFSWNSFTYFFTIALFCTLAEIRRRRNKKSSQWLWITNSLYFMSFLFLRSIFSTYFHQVDFETKIKLLMRLFF